MRLWCDCCCSARKRHSSGDSGERVVEVYSGHGHPSHVTTTPVTNGRSAHNTRSQVVDPAQLTSLDFENEGTPHTMIVQDPPSPAHSHDLNHNHNHIRHKPTGSSSKYLVHESVSSGGEDNYAYEGSLHNGVGGDNYVQENYGYDPGYSSERSPEDEEGPPIFRNSRSRSPSSSPQPSERPASLMLAPGEVLSTQQLQRLCPFIRESTSFEVCVVKNLRGLGLAVTGGVECEVPWAGLIRIKKLYPQTPAWLCGQLRVGDIVLSANSQPLTGLTSHEALEVLRTAGTEVTMQLCRPDFEDMDSNNDVLDGVNCGIPVVSTSLTAPTQTYHLSPSPSLSAYGEFEVSLTKVAGSLGFTLRKNDNSILGHTIRSLVKEPAISNGNLRAGDKIISVNERDMCSLTHEEAIGFLRTCPETVTLKLYRDAMQTPVSPVSPCEPEMIHKPKPLRKEARDMLEDLAFRKQSPCNSPSLNNTSSPGTPRRRRLQKTPSPDLKSGVDRWDSLVRKTCEDTSLPGSPTLDSQLSLKSIQESDYEDSPFSDSYFNNTSGHAADHTMNSRTSSASSNSYSASETERPIRPNFLDLTRGQSCSRKTEFTPPHERDQSFPPSPSPQYPSHHLHSQTPAHGLTSTHSDTHPAFSHHTPGYSSVNLGGLPGYSSVNLGSQAHAGGRTMTNTTSDHNLSGHPHGGVDETDGNNGKGLLKWKGVVFTPEEEDCPSLEKLSSDEYSEQTDEIDRATSPQNNIVTVKLSRGWNSRLGFSLQPQENGQTIITAIYADSVAAKDGRLQMGDRVVRVNGINCEEMSTEEIIDILRKTRGAISLGVLQESH